MNDWKAIAKEVEEAFRTQSVLTAKRATLERWMVALCLGSHEMMHEQEPMMRRLDALKHLVAVRLAEESEQRRDAQQAVASAAMRRQNFWTRVVSIAALILTGLGIWVNWWMKSPQPAVSSSTAASVSPAPKP